MQIDLTKKKRKVRISVLVLEMMDGWMDFTGWASLLFNLIKIYIDLWKIAYSALRLKPAEKKCLVKADSLFDVSNVWKETNTGWPHEVV